MYNSGCVLFERDVDQKTRARKTTKTSSCTMALVQTTSIYSLQNDNPIIDLPPSHLVWALGLQQRAFLVQLSEIPLAGDDGD